MSSPSSAPTPMQPRRRATRTRSGCLKCREKKVKCDEARPVCNRCHRLDRECDYTQLPRKPYTRRRPAASPPVQASSVASTTETVPDNAPTSPPIESSSAGLTASPSQSHEPGGGSRTLECCTPPEPDLEDHYRPAPDQDSTLPPDSGGVRVAVSKECASILSPFDYSAIHVFRSVLPEEGDSKTPEYSGPSMVWMLARESPMVLHMVCAIGGQKWCEMNPSSQETCARRMKAIEHYGGGLRLLVTITQASDGDMTRLEDILATLWLMILYELKFGDGCGAGLNTHLQGVASMIQSRLRSIQSEFDLARSFVEGEAEDNVSVQLSPESQCQQQRLSPASCKMIVWMALLDGGAVINGFGGAFNHLLGQAIPESSAAARLDCLHALQQRSSLVNHQTWGSAYPQDHLIDDMQNIQIACLYAESGQLRFLLGMLSETEHRIGGPDQDGRRAILREIRRVGTRYHEILCLANNLRLPEPGLQRQFVVMVRFVVPFYNAVVLYYFRVVKGHAPLVPGQREALKQIMSLAVKAFRDQGEKAITRLAWPLFVAALESDDVVHRVWILERYDELKNRGENYRRAREALRVAFMEQQMDERRIAYADLFRRSDVGLFLI